MSQSTKTYEGMFLVPPGSEILPFVDKGLWDQKSCADLHQELSR